MDVFEAFPSICDMPVDTPLAIDDHADHMIESFDLKVVIRSLKGSIQEVIEELDTDQSIQHFEFSSPFNDHKILYNIMIHFTNQ